MAAKQVWDSTLHLFLGNVVYTHFYVYVDPTGVQGPSLENAFTVQVDVRAAGTDLFSTGVVPLQNGPIAAAPTIAGGGTLGSVQGEIDDWNFTSGDWSTTTGVHFLISAKSDVTVPISELVKLVPGFGSFIGVAVGIFGSKVRVTVGHSSVTIPIVRSAAGDVTSINSVPIP
jgi:hypothetical protein